MNIACTNEEKVLVTAAPVTSSGKPARVDGALRITRVSGTGDFSQDAAEPLKFYAISGDEPGDTVFNVKVDADLGSGEVLIEDTVTLTVSSASAASFGLSAAAPEKK